MSRLLSSLVDAYGPSGREDNIRGLIQTVLKGAADELTVDALGNLIAVTQDNVKRMLAYSSIAHAGFILVPLVGAFTVSSGLPTGQAGSVASIMFYLVAYGFATIGCFAIVSLVRSQGREATGLEAWAGIGRRNPVIGVTMVVFLLSLAGIPLTAGFVGKFAAFAAAWRGGYWWLALVAILGSVVAVFIYIRIIQVMFFREPADVPEAQVAEAGAPVLIVLAVCLLGTVGLFIAPGPVLDTFQAVSDFLIPVAAQ